MRCRNPECEVENGRVIRDPSDNTRETGFCSYCRMRMKKENKVNERNTIVVKPKGRRKSKLTAIEKFEESLKSNPEYHEFVNMFRNMENPNVR